MNFEEKFPELHKCKWHFDPYGDTKAFLEEDIEEHCLSKQKVKEVMIYLTDSRGKINSLTLLEELGLDK